MADWDSKYIVTEIKKDVGDALWTPVFSSKEAMRLLCLDGDVIKDAFYMETAWFWPGKWPETKGDEGVVKEHVHEFPEVIAFIGIDPNDPYDLGGEIELWIDGKKNLIDKSFLAFIPPGTKHCPLTIKKINKPIFHFTAGMGGSYR
jgi:hypothetical protein